MHPHAHRLRQTIASGRPVIGTFLLQMTGAQIVNVMASTGLDFLLVDCEHGSPNPQDVAGFIEAAWGSGICLFVRTPHEGRALITRSLDAGAGGIVVPAINSMAQVHAVVEATKYPPLGRRGVHLFHGHTRHRDVDAVRFTAEANRDLFTFIQIETVESVEIIEEIAATPGVDGLYVGPADLAMSHGSPGNWDTPFFLAILKRVVAACERNGKIPACHANTLSQTRTLHELGVRVMGYSCDSGILNEAMTQLVDGFREICGDAPAGLNGGDGKEHHANGHGTLPVPVGSG